MHELSITQNILSTALEKASEAKAGKIIKVNLIIGELSGVVDECVQVCFDLLSKGTIAAKASLSFEKIPTQLRCRNCAATFSPDTPGWTCPNCGELRIEIISGRECYIDSIEVE